MNRLDPRLESQTHSLMLDPEHLASWSADGFAMARRLARAPVSVTGGLASTRLTLGLALETVTEPALLVPLHVKDERVQLACSADALDGLVGLLDPSTVPGAGQTASLDAVEALLAGFLAPLDKSTVGRARPVQDTGVDAVSIAALQFDAYSLPVHGSDAAIAMFYDEMSSKMDRLVAAPLSYLKQPNHRRAAVEVETLIGMVVLGDDERDALEPGGAVYLDAYWPSGRTSIGRRFVANEDGWRVDGCLAGSKLFVRSGAVVRGLDDPALAAPISGDGLLELVDGQDTIATGRLIGLSQDGDFRPIFALDRTG